MKTKLFNHLAETIATTHQQLQFEAASAVNKLLTLRNWLIGYYIVEYEQKGEDRAKYGSKIEESLAEKLNLDGLSARNLKLFKQFYLVYPNLMQTASAQLENTSKVIMQTVSAQFRRILKCHVLIELKAEAFTHENAGQLDVYLQYYKNEEMEKGDKPPIGILLCTESKETMVKYATANKENLLVSNYQVNLPSKEQLEAFIRAELNKKN